MREEVELELAGAIKIQDSRGEVVDAYPLHVRRQFAEYTAYLSHSFHVVRLTDHCPVRNDWQACEDFDLHWFFQNGRLAPFGVGAQLSKDPHEFVAGNRTPVNVTTDGASWQTARYPFLETIGSYVELEARRFQWADGQMVPSSDRWQVLDYRRGPPLARIPEYDFSVARMPSGDATFYRDEGTDLWARGFADAAVVEAVEANAEARRILASGGCFLRYSSLLQPEIPELSLIYGPRYSMTLEVAGPDGAVASFDVTVHRDLEQWKYDVTRGDDGLPVARECGRLGSPTTLPASSVLAAVEAMNLPGSAQTFEAGYRPEGIPQPLWHHFLAVAYTPNEVAEREGAFEYEDYSVRVDATLGRYHMLKVHDSTRWPELAAARGPV